MPELTPPGIRYEGAGRTFGSHVALRALDLEVAPGELLALVGTSGSGKTTALRLVNRMLEPSSGRVWLGERVVSELDPVALRRGIGYVIQEGGLFPHWTAAENVALVPSLLGWPQQRIQQCVRRAMALAQVPWASFGARRPSTLSGGQRQRVAVARALAAEPSVLLLDEPYGALDPSTRATLQDELRECRRKLGLTCILVTHDLEEAFRLADRIAVLHAGELLQVARPEELLLRPAHPTVASMLAPHLLELGIRFLTLEQLAPTLAPASEQRAVELDGSSTVAEALAAMALRECDAVMVRRGTLPSAGPFTRRSLWSVLGGMSR